MKLSVSFAATTGGVLSTVLIGLLFTRQATGHRHRASPHPIPTSQPSAPWRPGSRETCPVGMLSIPRGFLTGRSGMWSTDTPASDAGTDENGNTIAIDVVEPYCMDRTEVTVAQYRQCVVAGGCPEPDTTQQTYGVAVVERELNVACTAQGENNEQHPLNCVHFEAAQRYCSWHHGRLPTLLEWSFAARGTDGGGDIHRPVPQGISGDAAIRGNMAGMEAAGFFDSRGITLPSSVNYANDGWALTAPVGSFPYGASTFGILDMGGNVAEWVLDGYDLEALTPSDVDAGTSVDSSVACADGDSPPAINNARDETNESPRGDGRHTALGSCFLSTSTCPFIGDSQWHRGDWRSVDIGFRCVIPHPSGGATAPSDSHGAHTRHHHHE